MSSEDICNIDNVAKDEEINDNDSEVISEEDSDLDFSDQRFSKMTFDIVLKYHRYCFK